MSRTRSRCTGCSAQTGTRAETGRVADEADAVVPAHLRHDLKVRVRERVIREEAEVVVLRVVVRPVASGPGSLTG
jgi:hypothetical protein